MANRIAAMRVLADILQEQEDAKKSGERAGFYMGDFFATYGMSIPEGSDEFTLQAGVSPNVCGTKLCVAGFATLHAGYKLHIKSAVIEKWNGQKVNTIESVWSNPDGREIEHEPNWERVGEEFLELSEEEAKILFYSTFDDGEQAIEILTRLANGEKITRTEWAEYGRDGDIDMGGYAWTWKQVLGIEEDRCTCSYCY